MVAPVAAATATIDAVEVPSQTVAGHTFDATVTLTNHGDAEDVVLFAALYAPGGASPCGPATDARFRTFTQQVQQTIHLAKDATLTYPPPGERWSHRYDPDETPAGGEGEWCVFVAKAPGATSTVEYEAFRSTSIGVRERDLAPVASFSWTPQMPSAAELVTFLATGTDAEGDPISYTWDLGFVNASGRARGEGEATATRFFPEGTYTVTLTASDGFESSTVTHEVIVLPEGTSPATVTATKAAPTPLPLWAALVGMGLAVAGRLRRSSDRG